MAQRWKDGSRGMLTVCGLFAGFSGIVVVNVVINVIGNSQQWQQAQASRWFLASILMAFAALWLFVFAAERITDALDEEDVRTYVWSMLIYNIGVVLIFTSIACLLVYYLRSRWAAATAAVSLWPWGWHVVWLVLFKARRESYIRELEEPAS